MNIGNTLFGGGSHIFSPSVGSTTPLSGIASLVTLFLNIVFALAGLILLFFFIMGGIGMIGSAGKNDPQKAEQAKKTITSAVIGFIIVFVAYWIVQLILKLLGIQNLI